MPHGVASGPVNVLVKAAIEEVGDTGMRTTMPLYEIQSRARVRVADKFVGRRVVVEVWPNREENDEANYTLTKCRVLSSAVNPTWGRTGMPILVIEFEEGSNKRDLPVPMSTVHSIRTVD